MMNFRLIRFYVPAHHFSSSYGKIPSTVHFMESKRLKVEEKVPFKFLA